MGILDDAEVSGNEIPKDPFGFGNDYWEVELYDVRPPKDEQGNPSQQQFADIAKSGKSYGAMFVFRVLDERFAYLGSNSENQVPGQLGAYGQWWTLPSPKWARDRVPFDKNSKEGKQLVFNWSRLCYAVGIPVDQIGAADFQDVIGKSCLAKVKVTEDDNGFWQFRCVGFKRKGGNAEGSPQGIGEFTKGGTSNPAPQSGMSAMEKALQEEANQA